MLNESLFSSKTPEWATPQDFFNKLDAEFHFDLDPCSTHENAKCARHFTKEDDGLSKEWTGSVFCNPPYGRVLKNWVKKAYETFAGGGGGIRGIAYPSPY